MENSISEDPLFSSNFDYSDLDKNVRHVTRLRKFLDSSHGVDPQQEYYQSLLDSYKQNSDQDERTNSIPASVAGSRLQNHFHDDFAAAGRVLLQTNPNNNINNNNNQLQKSSFEQQLVSDCHVPTAGSKATLWSRTLKDWRREKIVNERNRQKTTEEEELKTDAQRLSQQQKEQQQQQNPSDEAMSCINAQFHTETEVVRSRMRASRVEEWTASAISSKLPEKTKSAVSRIQHVISNAKKLEKQLSNNNQDKIKVREELELREENINTSINNNIDGSPGDQDTSSSSSVKKTSREQQQQEYFDSLVNQDTPQHAELNGLWLRNLLPGQKTVHLHHHRHHHHHHQNNNEEEDDNNSNYTAATSKNSHYHDDRHHDHHHHDTRHSKRSSATELSSTAATDFSSAVASEQQFQRKPKTHAGGGFLTRDNIKKRANRILFGKKEEEEQQQQQESTSGVVAQTKSSGRASTASSNFSVTKTFGGDLTSSQKSKNNNNNNNNSNNKNDVHPQFLSSSSSSSSSCSSSSFSSISYASQNQYDDYSTLYADDDDDDTTTISGQNKSGNENNNIRRVGTLSDVTTAKSAHSKVLLLLNAEMYGGRDDDDDSNENNSSQQQQQQQQRKEPTKKMTYREKLEAQAKYKKENSYFDDSRNALVYSFEIFGSPNAKKQEEQETQRTTTSPSSSMIQQQQQQQQQSVSASALTPSSSSFSSSESLTSFEERQVKKKSESLQKILKNIELLESGKLGTVVTKKKFKCRIERGKGALSSTTTTSSASLQNVFGDQQQSSSLLDATMTKEQQQSASATEGEKKIKSEKEKNLIPELISANGKYHQILDIKLNHMDPATGQEVNLRSTNIPEPDLFVYKKYAQERNMILIIRPVSQVVPDLYATPGLHIKGKSINVSLKSSSYPPIYGLIPVNPQLGKAFLDTQRRERELEDLVLNATGGDSAQVVTMSLIKRLTLQAKAAGSATQAFKRDIVIALERSEKELTSVMDEYREKLVVTVEKEEISRSYIERFNEAQFLGTTHATWKGMGIFYREIPAENAGDPKIERDPKEAPVFYIEPEKDSKQLYRYDPDADVIADQLAEEIEQLHPVMAVTHRMFAVSETTNRIEVDPTLFMIGPDFDGLCYAKHVSIGSTAAERLEWATKINEYQLVRSMGLVNEFDIEHVKEVRMITEWKQNHGYECGNTVKTQPIGAGPHVVITPEGFGLLNNVYEICSYIRNCWLHNIPLLLNPNWRVVLDEDLLPRLYGEDLTLPTIDDCGAAASMMRFEVDSFEARDAAQNNLSFASVKNSLPSMEERIRRIEAELEKQRRAGVRFKSKSGESYSTVSGEEPELPLEEAVILVLDKKFLAECFYDVRRWQLMPPVMRETAAATSSCGGGGSPLSAFSGQVPSSPTSLGSPSSSLSRPASPTSAESNNSNTNNATTSAFEKASQQQQNKNSSPTSKVTSPATTTKTSNKSCWYTEFIEPGPDFEFERCRQQNVDEMRKIYKREKERFLYLHKERSSHAFILNLDDYLDPERN